MFELHTNKQCKHSQGCEDVIMSKFNTPKIVSNVHKIKSTHVQYWSNYNLQSLNMKD